MRTVKGLRAGRMVGVLVGVVLAAGAASAQMPSERFTTERPGSILIFPKVINCGTRDTTIQISNTSNMAAQAKCFYVNGASYNGVQLWQVSDFNLALTRQQPTHWTVGAGRSTDPTDSETGLDPGLVPPQPECFTGGLVCVEINPGGDPSGANSLKGEATVAQAQADDAGAAQGASKYSAVAIEAIDPDADNVLNLDNIEYAACPAGAHLNFVAEGAPDEIVTGLGNGANGSAVSTTLTFMPCSMDFENLIPSRTTLAFAFSNEMEEPGSTSTSVECWGSVNVGDLGADLPGLGTLYGYARITAESGTDDDPVGVVGVANVARVGSNGAMSTAATNLHFLGNDSSTNLDSPPSVIRLPE
jgi:hypothetical protein